MRLPGQGGGQRTPQRAGYPSRGMAGQSPGMPEAPGVEAAPKGPPEHSLPPRACSAPTPAASHHHSHPTLLAAARGLDGAVLASSGPRASRPALL